MHEPPPRLISSKRQLISMGERRPMSTVIGEMGKDRCEEGPKEVTWTGIWKRQAHAALGLSFPFQNVRCFSLVSNKHVSFSV
jgi:hypothetical protein